MSYDPTVQVTKQAATNLSRINPSRTNLPTKFIIHQVCHNPPSMPISYFSVYNHHSRSEAWYLILSWNHCFLVVALFWISTLRPFTTTKHLTAPPPWDAFQQVFVGDLLYIALNLWKWLRTKGGFPIFKQQEIFPPKSPKWIFFPSSLFGSPMYTEDFTQQKKASFLDPNFPYIQLPKKWWFRK